MLVQQMQNIFVFEQNQLSTLSFTDDVRYIRKIALQMSYRKQKKYLGREKIYYSILAEAVKRKQPEVTGNVLFCSIICITGFSTHLFSKTTFFFRIDDVMFKILKQ